MNDASLMGVVQGLGHAGDELGSLVWRWPPRCQQIGQRDPFDEITDQVGRVFQRANLVDDNDGRMAELGDAAGFAQETRQVLRLVADIASPRDLDRHGAVELRVAGFVDCPKSAGAEVTDELKTPNHMPAAVPIRARHLFQPKGGPAGDTGHFLARIEIHQLDGILAMRAMEMNLHRALSGCATVDYRTPLQRSKDKP